MHDSYSYQMRVFLQLEHVLGIHIATQYKQQYKIDLVHVLYMKN